MRTRNTTRVLISALIVGLMLIVLHAASPSGDGAGPASAAGAMRCHILGKGTSRADRFVGTLRGDLVKARGGRDRIFGSGGGDCLRGGRGGDRIRGGDGRDNIRAGAGPDRLAVADGVEDVVNCGRGADRVIADAIDDLTGCEQIDIAPPIEPPPGPAAECAVDVATLTAPGCRLVNTDNGVDGDVGGLWGNLECVNSSRHRLLASGGDFHPTGTGDPQGDSSYRRLTVLDGDNYSGERCELGRNEYRYGTDGGNGTFALYREGTRRITFASMRIPDSLPIGRSDWRTVLQMKQAQPANNGGSTPIIALELRENRFILAAGSGPYWSTPAVRNRWIRIALDVTYSRFAGQGSVKMYMDLNGDGDATDAGEQSPGVTGATLKQETAPGSTSPGSIAPGASIPSHLRIGVYQNPVNPCPGGCSLEVDNVQVARPA